MTKLSPEQARQMIQRIASQSKVRVEKSPGGGVASGTSGFGIRQQSQSATTKPSDTSPALGKVDASPGVRSAQEEVRAVRSPAPSAQPGFGVRRTNPQPRSTTADAGNSGPSPDQASGPPSQQGQQRSWLEQGVDILKDVGAAVVEGAVEELVGKGQTVTDSTEAELGDVLGEGVAQQDGDDMAVSSSEPITVVPGFKFARVVSRRKNV